MLYHRNNLAYCKGHPVTGQSCNFCILLWSLSLSLSFYLSLSFSTCLFDSEGVLLPFSILVSDTIVSQSTSFSVFISHTLSRLFPWLVMSYPILLFLSLSTQFLFEGSPDGSAQSQVDLTCFAWQQQEVIARFILSAQEIVFYSPNESGYQKLLLVSRPIIHYLQKLSLLKHYFYCHIFWRNTLDGCN